MRFRSWGRWAVAGGLAAGLIALYFVAWRPARALLTEHVAHPLLTSVETKRADAFRYSFKRGALRIGIRSPRPSVDASDYHAPAGRDFLLPALLLALLFPYRPYWLYLWGFHLAVGALFLGLLALGIAWTDGAFVLHRFLEHYVVQALSLGAPLLALAYERGVFSPPPGDGSSPTSLQHKALQYRARPVVPAEQCGAPRLALLCLGVLAGNAWFVLSDALTRSLVDAFSLGVAAWAVAVELDLGPSFPNEEP